MHVYSQFPWLIKKDPVEVSDFFKVHGKTIYFKAGEDCSFGHEHCVYFVTKGILYTYVEWENCQERLMGFWTEGCSIGAVKALNGSSVMPLRLRSLSDSNLIKVDACLYRNYVYSDPDRMRQILTNCINKCEGLMDGLAMNDLLSVEKRLCQIIGILLNYSHIPHGEWVGFGFPVTVTTLALFTHSDRVVVSRIINQWVKTDLVRKDKQALFFKPSFML